MFRARSPQKDLFSARNQYRDALEDDSFHALLSDFGEELFDDYSFEYLYCEDNGRPCVPPSQMFILLLLQMRDGCSDKEAVERARWDLRWLAALDMEPSVRLCGKSTLQEFRARVLLHEAAEKQFKSILMLARKLGIIKGPLQVAMDTTPILGRGAVKDTYNMIGCGIRKVAQTLAKMERVTPEYWAGLHDFGRYWEASSLKGEAGIDWTDDAQKRVFLNSLVADAERILLMATTLAKTTNTDHAAEIVEASALLRRIIVQDTEPVPKSEATTKDPPREGTEESQSAANEELKQGSTPPKAPEKPKPADEESTEGSPLSTDGEGDDLNDRSSSKSTDEAPKTAQGSHLLGQMVQIRKGTVKDRIISVHDPEMRHGRKSASHLFNGYKLSIVNDTNSGMILSLDLLDGNAGDNVGALKLVEQAQENTGLPVKKAIGDCAYGDGATRQSFSDAGIDLSAKVPAPRKSDKFPKTRFILDLTSKIATATCPEGKTTGQHDYARPRNGTEPQKRFRFSAEDCAGCSHREECLRAIDKKRGWGRSIVLHAQEELLQKARKRQAEPEFREEIKARQTVERILGRCVQLGARQARYFGKSKTRFQMLMIALVANLTTVGRALVALLLVAIDLLCWLAQSWFSNSNVQKLKRFKPSPVYSMLLWQRPGKRPLESRGFRLAF